MILLVVMMVDFILYRIFLSLFGILVFVAPVTLFGLFLAFAKVNKLPVHYFILNLIQTLRRPSLRVWDNDLSEKELRALLKKGEVAPLPPPLPQKSPLNVSRLEELSLIVNTGGLYNPEDDVTTTQPSASYGK